ncbi:GerAB/ArcD/ProY family transporter [Bacillus sp. BP-3]|uniref:GerAB/ArcD/ProY family transporter n=1 Tax=Bacillus sp. BP-3 TaxID=3022773 RepID=UPI002330A701|nr:GerAB/ArcD/ProY family transporter [Bacillus sp. BP-3]MDC2867867.1 GerAB/ArcD/ProY family transporter [Bacillus sp. BP-3]
MQNVKITGKQLFSLIVLFELGTAIVVPLGLVAKQDAWITVIIGLMGGVVLFFFYGLLSHLYPGLPLTSYTKQIFGKYIGSFISLFYILFFIYGAARDLRDGGEFLQTAMYDQTPLFALNAIMLLTIAYVLYKGLDVLARTGEIYFFIMIILGVIGILLILFSGLIEIKNIQPILGEGWLPILTAAYPRMVMFPFGETICFTMILSSLDKPQLGIKMGISAMIFSGIILCLITLIEITVLGADIAARTTFPLLTTISKVNIADFLQRLDIIVVLALIMGDFFKVAIFFYAAVIGATDLFNLKNNKGLVLSIGIMIFISSMIIASNFSQHLVQGDFSLRSIFILFSLLLPFLLLVVAFIRKKFNLRHSSPNPPV